MYFKAPFFFVVQCRTQVYLYTSHFTNCRKNFIWIFNPCTACLRILLGALWMFSHPFNWTLESHAVLDTFYMTIVQVTCVFATYIFLWPVSLCCTFYHWVSPALSLFWGSIIYLFCTRTLYINSYPLYHPGGSSSLLFLTWVAPRFTYLPSGVYFYFCNLSLWLGLYLVFIYCLPAQHVLHTLCQPPVPQASLYRTYQLLAYTHTWGPLLLSCR